MPINILSNKPNGSVIIHATEGGTVALTGNDSVSNLASTGEIVVGSSIKQIWTGSSSGNGANWIMNKGNSSVNAVIGVYDSTAWIDYAGNGFTLKMSEDAETLYLTLNNATAGEAYLMVEVKKVVGPA